VFWAIESMPLYETAMAEERAAKDAEKEAEKKDKKKKDSKDKVTTHKSLHQACACTVTQQKRHDTFVRVN
jgi:hypothetical protein